MEHSITFKNKGDGEYYANKSKELGYKSLSDFALAAMDKKIEKENYVVYRFNKVAELLYDTMVVLEMEETDAFLSPEDAQALKVSRVAHGLIVNTALMRGARENLVSSGKGRVYRHELSDGIDYEKVFGAFYGSRTRKVRLRGIAKTGEVSLDGKPLDAELSRKVLDHSFGGFSWGYGGSGPAQLALAVCLELFTVGEALQRHQGFKGEYISALPFEKDFDVTIEIPLKT